MKWTKVSKEVFDKAIDELESFANNESMMCENIEKALLILKDVK